MGLSGRLHTCVVPSGSVMAPSDTHGLLRKSQLLLQDLKLLRLVCSWLNLSMEPVVLSCVRLDVFNHTPARTMHQLETLASQRSRASKYTRTLEIASLVPSRDHDGTILAQCVQFLLWNPIANMVEVCVRKHLATAISSMENVGSVM
jgi:hypothetical protein